jgi:hydrogenase maturation protease
LVLGIGNLLLGDEGVGVRAARRLEESDLKALALIVDGGTGGFQLLSFFSEHDRIIMIDAAADGRPSGTVSLLRPKFARDFPKSLSAHDIGLKDLIEAASLLGGLPDISLITVSVETIQPMTLDLSPPVEAALPEIERIVRALLARAEAAPAAD